jgi:hypothetical protein
MNLWLLRPNPDVLSRRAHPWTPSWDKVFGMVIRAATEETARALAQSRAGNEGAGVYRKLGASEDERAENVWLTAEWTTCEELSREGEASVILVDSLEG